MAGTNLKRPELRISGNMSENFKNFEMRFNDYCMQMDYRDPDKNPSTEADDHHKKPVLEIAALRSAMPDEALQVIRYTIEPQIATADKKKAHVWMEKLRAHYTGSIGSSLMTDRFKFWHLSQSSHESVQDWEVKIRQGGNLCNYGASADEMNRDKFVFGLYDTSIRTELLKTHLKADQSSKSLSDVVCEAKTLESAQRTNQLITDTKSLDEQVHWTTGQTNTRSLPSKKHKDMKLKREENTCHWCGSLDGYHPWRNCPANGKTCSKCGVNDHFARVCLEPSHYKSSSNSSKSSSNFNTHSSYPSRGRYSFRGRGASRGFKGNRGFRGKSTGGGYRSTQEEQLYSVDDCGTDQEYYTDNYESSLLPAPTFCLDTKSDVHHVSTTPGKKYFACLPTSATGSKFHPVKFQIDTAATCNTMSEDLFNQHFLDAKLMKSPLLLFPYGNSKPLQPLGQTDLMCERNKQYYTLTFQVLPSLHMENKPPLLSGFDSVKLGLVNINADDVFALQGTTGTAGGHLNKTNHVPVATFPPKRSLLKADLLAHYSSSFSGVGYLGPPVSFQMKSDVTPLQMPIHRVPVCKRAKEKSAIDNYVKAGILEKVQDPTPWCSNILCRETPGKFRVCIDPSQTINKAIERPIYQMPTLTEQLHNLHNAKIFSVIDVKDGYLHVPLDDDSSNQTAMHTSYGRYRWKRLPFGISSAPEEFQIRLMTALEGLKGIALVADDILVFGSGDTANEAEANHDECIIALLERAAIKNIKFNPDKFKFKQKELKFIGHIISADGMKIDPDKVAAINNMPPPSDKSSLLRFIGMVNYLSPFCHNLSHTIRPLTELTKDGMIFNWSHVQDDAFQQAKYLIVNAPVLQYFNLNHPVTLQVDASDCGLGGALLQPNSLDMLQPVAYTSCSLNATERRYSQIEKECLAICNTFAKFDQWLYGKSNITVHTDHKPLEVIFKKPLNKAPARLQRMMMKLQRYQFTVVYKKGCTLVLADTLSRANMSSPISCNVTDFEVFRVDVENCYPEQHPNFCAETQSRLADETRNDPILQSLGNIIRNGWPASKRDLEKGLFPYWGYRDELSIHDGIIYKGELVFIPSTMIKPILSKIHTTHFGAASCYRMAKDILTWPGMKGHIQDACDACAECAKYQSCAPKETMKSLPVPTLPWQIISQDLFEFAQQPYLVTVDHFSDWIEVDKLQNTFSNTVIKCTKSHFARFGTPQICHTDNGSQFISKDFRDFSLKFGFKHTKSSPYHPKGNGRAEAAVKVAKNMLKKCSDFDVAMLHYRNTPQQGHSYSPSQRLLNRRTRTLLPTSNQLLLPDLVDMEVVTEEILCKRRKAATVYNRSAPAEHTMLGVGTYAYAKPPPHQRGKAWAYGQIVDRNEATRSYTIQTPVSIIRRNRVHLRPAAAPSGPLEKVIYVTQPISSPDRTESTIHPQGALMGTTPSDYDSGNYTGETAVTDRSLPSPLSGAPGNGTIHCASTPVLPDSSDSMISPDTVLTNSRPKRLSKQPAKYDDFVM